MKKQVFNPYLPSYEYIPDGEPRVFGGRLYIYGSHDRFNGEFFCLNDYVCWSTPVDDLSDWRYEGVIYKKTQDPENADGTHVMYAPDVVQGLDGRYYMYYGLEHDTKLGVAVADSPVGPFEFLDMVRDKNGVPLGRRPQDFIPFDPGIIVEGPGEIHLYIGQGPMTREAIEEDYKSRFRYTSFHVCLEDDMLTLKDEPVEIVPSLKNSEGTGFEGHEFFEANSIRKFNGKYYFIYSSYKGHELCYAVSDYPDKGFEYRGVLHSNGDVFCEEEIPYFDAPDPRIKFPVANNHGSIEPVNGHYYVFGHRHTNGHKFSRQAVAEEVFMDENGDFGHVEMTSCGLNGGPLKAEGKYPTGIAIHVQSVRGCGHTIRTEKLLDPPYITQSGVDREDDPDQYVVNIRNGSCVGFRYFDFTKDNASKIILETRGAAGKVSVYTDADRVELLSEVSVEACENWKFFEAELKNPGKVSALYFYYEGEGIIDFRTFTLA